MKKNQFLKVKNGHLVLERKYRIERLRIKR